MTTLQHFPVMSFDDPRHVGQGILNLRGNLPGACPARYLCIKYLVSSPKFILTLGSPPNTPHWTANLLCKATCVSRNMTIQQHKMSLPPLPTTIPETGCKGWAKFLGMARRYSKLFGEVGAKTGTSGEWSKKDARRAPGALTLSLTTKVNSVEHMGWPRGNMVS